MAAPAQPNFRIHANTAASLLHYVSYDKPRGDGTSEKCWTRFASADEHFNIAAAGGSRYLIKFDSNFSKKHLATFSKKEWKTEGEKWLQSQQAGQAGKDQENWNRAQKQLLDNKILRTLGIRNPKCTCGHPKKPLAPGDLTSGHTNNGNGRCKHQVVPVGGGAAVPCPCVSFTAAPNAYEAKRTAENKPVANPLAGAATNQSSCIVLNWIPKNEFEQAVVTSIVNAEAAHQVAHPGAVIPNYVANGPLTKLRWSFPGRPGAVRHAQNGTVDVDNGTWCEVGAKKTAGGPGGITSTWTVAHWEGQG